MDTLQKVRAIIHEAAATYNDLLNDAELLDGIIRAADCLCNVFSNGGRVLFCGNGGSAADAQHLAAELTGKFLYDRKPLDAEVLHGNTSYITAYSNDHGYAGIFARLIEAKGRKGDVLFAISTSGNSENIILALIKAKELGLSTIALTGKDGGRARNAADIVLLAPAITTPRIQECHILIGHSICQLVEERMRH